MPRVIKVLTKATREERKQARRGISLHELPKTTVNRYNKALLGFFKWLHQSDCVIEDCCDLDLAVSQFIVFLWEDGETVGLAGDTLSGLEYHIRFLKSKLKGGWKLITTWRKRELPNRAPPPPFSVCLALAGMAMSIDDLGFCCGILVGFHCFLRSMELFTLRASDIVLGEHKGVVQLASTKKGQLDIVVIYDPFVLKICKLRVAQLSPHELLCGHDPRTMRTMFHQFMRILSLQDGGYKWYSLRRGGATRHFQAVGNLDSTLYRGRWESSRTARIYLAEGLAALCEIQFSAETSALVANAALELASLC